MTATTKHSPYLNQSRLTRLVLPVLFAGILILALGLAFQPNQAAQADTSVAALAGTAKTLVRQAPVAAAPEVALAADGEGKDPGPSGDTDDDAGKGGPEAQAPATTFGGLTAFFQTNGDSSPLGIGQTTTGALQQAVYVWATSPAGTFQENDTLYLEIQVAELVAGVPNWAGAMEFRSAPLSKPEGGAADYPSTLVWGLEAGKYYAWQARECAEGVCGPWYAAPVSPDADAVDDLIPDAFNRIGALGDGTIYPITDLTETGVISGDGICSLREAVIAASKNITVNECAPGTLLLDVIYLSEDGDYVLSNDGSDAADILDGADATPDLTIYPAGIPVSSTAGFSGGPLLILGTGALSTTIRVDPTFAAVSGARIFEIMDGADAVTITQLTLSGGAANNWRPALFAFSELDGGAIINYNMAITGPLVLDDIILEDNSAANGGSLYNYGYTYLTDSIVRGNSAVYDFYSSWLAFPTAYGGHGGGIYNAGYISLDNVQVEDNTADSPLTNNPGGGGLYNTGFADIFESTFSSNGNLTTTGRGGAIGNFGGLINLTDSTVKDNQAAEFGGGLYNTLGAVFVDGSTFSGNQISLVGQSGAAIFQDFLGGAALLQMVNSTVSGNQALGGFAGGIFIDGGTAILLHVTVAYNTSAQGAAGIQVRGACAGAALPTPGGLPLVSLQNTVVGLNTSSATEPSPDEIAGYFSTGGYNLIADPLTGLGAGACDSTDGTNLTNDPTTTWNVAPQLAPLQDNGGPTWTHMPLGAIGDPLVDKIPVTTVFVDQRDYPRPWDATLPGVGPGGNSDIGAVEFYGVLGGIGPVYNEQLAKSYPTLQLALDDPLNSDGDNIWVMYGVPQPMYTREGTDQIGYFYKNNDLFGGWDGLFPLTQTMPNTVLDPTFFGDAGRVLVLVNKNGSVDQFDLVNGDATAEEVTLMNGYGGNVFVSGGDLILSSTQVLTGYAAYGGGLYLGSSLVVTGTLFENNYALGNGGAIYVATGDVTLSEAEFYTNTAEESGGAIFIEEGTLDDMGSDYYFNEAGDSGGGVFLYNALGAFDDILASMNNAGTDGGALFNAHFYSLTLTSGEFYTNTAGNDAGAIYSDRDLFVDSVTFEANTAAAEGGAIKVDGTKTYTPVVDVQDSTFESNIAFGDTTLNSGDGGAIFASDNVYVLRSTFRNNVADNDAGLSIGEGGAIYSYQGTEVFIEDSFFFTNTAYNEGGAVHVDNSDWQTTILPEVVIPGVLSATVQIRNTYFRANSVDGTFGDDGGAVNLNIGLVQIWNSDFYSNTANSSNGDGGAVNVDDGQVEIWDIFLFYNTAGNNGGAVAVKDLGGAAPATTEYDGDIYIYGSALYATNFTENFANDEGGGVWAAGDGTMVGAVDDGVYFFWNETYLWDGGGAYVEDSAYITQTYFYSNHTGEDGGGLNVELGDAYIYETEFVDNEAPWFGVGEGGGMNVELGFAEISYSLFDNNFAAKDGGGAWVYEHAILDQVDFTNNVADTGNGGGLYVATGYVTDLGSSSTFYYNEAQVDGGGAWVATNAQLHLTEFYSNTALTGNGGGLWAGTYLSATAAEWYYNVADDNGGGAYIVTYAELDETLWYYNVVTNTNGGGLWTGTYMDDFNSNSQFYYNQAQVDGGGAHIGTNAFLNSSDFYSNTALTGNGGGLWAGGYLSATAATWYYNWAEDNGGGAYISDYAELDETWWYYNVVSNTNGGGLWTGTYMDDFNSNSQFYYNQAQVDGGGAHIGAHALLNSTDFYSNTALTGNGGGLWAGTYLSATGATWYYNWAFLNGGGAYVTTYAELDETMWVENVAFTVDGGGLWAGTYLTDLGSYSQFIGNWAAVDGGGAHIGTTSELHGTLFYTNTAAAGDGGGLWTGSHLTATVSMWDDNYANNDGGGAYVETGHTYLITSTFQYNLADDDDGFGDTADGGGLWTYDYLYAEDSTWFMNDAGNDGGGAYVATSGAELYDSLFDQNNALGETLDLGWWTDSDGNGGGLWTFDYLTATATTWVTNTANDDGGGAHIGGDIWLYDSLFRDNLAFGREGGSDAYGGGLWGSQNMWAWDTQWITNFSEDHGGGAYIAGDAFTWDCLFLSNEAGTLVLPDVYAGPVGPGPFGWWNIEYQRKFPAPGTDPFYGNGGGIFVAGDLTDFRSLWDTNVASDSGGGAYVNSFPTVYLTDSIFQYNMAAGYDGGGLWANTAFITTSLFLTNTAGDDGGGAYINFDATILTSTFEFNYAAGHFFGAYGGGMYIGDDLLMLQDSIVYKNTAANSDGDIAWGGGIYLGFNGGTNIANIYTSTISCNLASGDNGAGGGMAADSGSDVYIQASTFITNVAENRAFALGAPGPAMGGGFYGLNTDVFITTTLFEDNSALGGLYGGLGGGLFNGAETDIYRSEFLFNTASSGGMGGGFGGGAYITNGSGTDRAYLENVIFAGNFADGAEGHQIVLSGLDDGAEVIHNTLVGIPPKDGQLAAAPCLECLADSTLIGSAVYITTLDYDLVSGADITAVITESIVASHTIGLHAEVTGPGAYFASEDWNMYDNVLYPVVGFPMGVNSFVGESHFADPLNADFHLLPPSDAIDGGEPTSIPQDFDYIDRPQGPAVDNGVYELPQVTCPYTDTGCHFHVYVMTDTLYIDVYTSTSPMPYDYVGLAFTVTYNYADVYALMLVGGPMTDSVKADNTGGNPFPQVGGMWFFGDGGNDYTILTGTVPVSDVVYSFNEAVTGSITGTATTDQGTLFFFDVEGESWDFLTKDDLTFNYNVCLNYVAFGPGTAMADGFSFAQPFDGHSVPTFFTNPVSDFFVNGSECADTLLNYGLEGSYGGSYAFYGLGGDDQLVEDFTHYVANGHPFGGYSFFDGGLQDTTDGDEIILQNGSALNVIHNLTSPSTGDITVDAVPLVYVGLEPVFDYLTVADRDFVFGTGLADTGTLGNNGLVNVLASDNSETIEFWMATNTLDVFLGIGDDNLVVTDLLPNPTAYALDVVTVTVYAEEGNDFLDASAITFGIVVDGGVGDDEIETGSGHDVLYDGAGDDILDGQAGNDWYRLELKGTDMLIDGAGVDDLLDFSYQATGITIDMDSANVQIVNTAGDTLQLVGQFEELIASDKDDTATVKVLPILSPPGFRYASGEGETLTDTLWIDADGMPILAYVLMTGTVKLDVGYSALFEVPFDGYIDVKDRERLYFYEWENVWIINTTGEFEISKTGPVTVTAGTEIQYTITITHADQWAKWGFPVWPFDVVDIEVQDYPPDGIDPQTIVITEIDPEDQALCSNEWSCNFGTLGYGHTATIVLTALVDPSLPEGTVLTNTATVFAENIAVDYWPYLYDDTDFVTTTVETSVSLGVVKEDLNDVITAGGDPVIYTIVVWNDGDSDAYDVEVADTVAAGFTAVTNLTPAEEAAATLYGVTCTGLTCTIGWLPAGASIEFYVTLEAASSLQDTSLNQDGTSFLADTACVTGDETYVTYNPQCETEATLVINRADLSLVKKATPTAIAGELITYTLTVFNNGPSDNFGYTVIDELPPFIIDVVSMSAACTETSPNAQVECDATGLVVGGTDVYTIVVRSDPSVLPGTSLENNAEVLSWTTPDPRLLNNVDDADTSILAKADLTVEKTGPTTDVAGTTITYEMHVVNNGPSDAYGVKLIDNLPDEVTFINATTSLGACDTGGTCLLGTMAVGQDAWVTIVGMIDSAVLSGTEITNNVEVITDESDSMDPDGAFDDWNTLITAEAALFIEKEDLEDGMTAGGAAVQYVITVRNDGPSDALDVVVTDEVMSADGFQYGSDLEPGNQYMSCVANVCTFDLPVGESVEIYALVYAESWVDDTSVDQDGTSYVTNDACVEITGDVDDLTADPCDDEATVVFNAADLNIDKAATPTAIAGMEIVYNIALENVGPSDAEEIVITDFLPLSVTYLSSSDSFGNPGTYAAGDHSVTFSTPYLEVWDWTFFTITVVVDPSVLPGTSLENTVQAFGVEYDPNWLNNYAFADTSILASSDLELTKTGPATVVAGTEATYTIEVTNNGPSDAYDVTILDNIDEETMTLVSSQLEGSDAYCSGETCEWPGQLAVGQTIEMVVTVLVHSDVVSGTTIVNSATVDTDSIFDTDTANDTDEVETLVTAEVAASIFKDSLVDTILAGDGAVQFVIRVYNAGPSDAYNLTFNDTAAAGFSYASELEPGNELMTCTGNTCTIAHLPVGQSVEAYASMTAASSNLAGLKTANTACITGVENAELDASDCAVAQITVVNDADLSIGKVAPATVFAGEYMTYTIVVFNAGPSDAQSVQVVDVLPADVTYEDYTSTACTLVSGTTFNCGTIVAGGSATIEIVVFVDADIEPGVSLQNMATVSSTTPDVDDLNNVAYADTSVVGLADLQLNKTGPTTVVAGTAIEYTITVFNAGPSDAQAVDIKDDLPAWVDLTSATVTLPGAEGPVLCGGTVCQVGDLPEGATATVTVQGMVDPSTPAGTTLTNAAAVFSATDDDDTSDNSDTAATTVTTSADLKIEKVALIDPVAQGGMQIFEIHVYNLGPSDAQAVVMSDILPTGMTYVSVSPASGCSFASNTVTCNIATLAAGDHEDYLLVAMVNTNVVDGTVINNTATVSATTSDPVSGNNTSTDSFTVNRTLIYTDLAITKTASSPTVAAGGTVTFNIVVTNNGPTRATSVEILDSLPNGMSLVSITPVNSNLTSTGAAQAPTCDIDGAECFLGEIPNGGTATVTIVAMVDADAPAGTLTNSATVYGNEADNASANNTASASVTVSVTADLEITKSDNASHLCEEDDDRQMPGCDPSFDEYVEVGERLVYELVVTNSGPAVATEVVVTDYLPEEVSFVAGSSDEDCTEAYDFVDGDLVPTGVITCDVEDLLPGESDVIYLEVLVTPILPDNTVIENCAEVDGLQADPDGAEVCHETLVRSFADLSVTKVADKTEYLTGMPMRFDIEIRNAGPHIAAYVYLEDDFDAAGDLVFFASSASQGYCTYDEGWVECDLGHLAPYTAEYGYPVIHVTLWAYANTEGTFVNSAYVWSESYDEDLSDNLGVSDPYTVYNERLVYSMCFNDGNTANDSIADWTLPGYQGYNALSTTPLGGRQFFGEFGNYNETPGTIMPVLSLDGLISHKRLRVELTLFAIRSLDGNNIIDPWDGYTPIGPDIFEIGEVNGSTTTNVFRSTFNNWDITNPTYGPPTTQAYPGQHPGGTFNPQALREVDYTLSPDVVPTYEPWTSSAEQHTLGYQWRTNTNLDSVYDIGYRANFLQDEVMYPMIIWEHTASSVDIKVGYPDLQPRFYDIEQSMLIYDESWGLECFNVYIQGTDLIYHVFLPLVVR